MKLITLFYYFAVYILFTKIVIESSNSIIMYRNELSTEFHSQNNLSSKLAFRNIKKYPQTTKLKVSVDGYATDLKHHQIKCPNNSALTGFQLWGKFGLLKNKFALQYSCISKSTITNSISTLRSNLQIYQKKAISLKNLFGLYMMCPKGSLLKSFVLKENGKNIFYKYSCVKAQVGNCQGKILPFKPLKSGYMGAQSISQLDQFSIKATKGFGIQMLKGTRKGKMFTFMYVECKLNSIPKKKTAKIKSPQLKKLPHHIESQEIIHKSKVKPKTNNRVNKKAIKRGKNNKKIKNKNKKKNLNRLKKALSNKKAKNNKSSKFKRLMRKKKKNIKNKKYLKKGKNKNKMKKNIKKKKGLSSKKANNKKLKNKKKGKTKNNNKAKNKSALKKALRKIIKSGKKSQSKTKHSNKKNKNKKKHNTKNKNKKINNKKNKNNHSKSNRNKNKNKNYRKKKNIQSKLRRNKPRINIKKNKKGDNFCFNFCVAKPSFDKKCYEGGVNKCNSCVSKLPVTNYETKNINNLCKTICNQSPKTKKCSFYPYKMTVSRKKYDKKLLKKVLLKKN